MIAHLPGMLACVGLWAGCVGFGWALSAFVDAYSVVRDEMDELGL